MKRNSIDENFMEEYYNGAANMTQKELVDQRRQRKMSNFLHSNKGEWFSFYDNIQEKNQWATALSDIIYAFNIIYDDYKKGINTNTRIFVACSGQADMTNLTTEIKNYLKYLKKQFNFVTIPETITKEDIPLIQAQMGKIDTPTVVIFEMRNHTYDDVMSHNIAEKEIADIIDNITTSVLPKSGIVVYMEELSQLPDDEDEIDEFDYSKDQTDEFDYSE